MSTPDLCTYPLTPAAPAAQDCIHCTVPTANPDGICIFCADYTPPAEGDPAVGELADAYSTAVTVADRLGELASQLPADVPLWGVVDVVTAAAHLRAAARLIDRAAEAVTR